MATHYAHQALGKTFILDAAYSDVKSLGTGAYGDVVSAKRTNETTGEDEWVAVKRVKGISTKSESGAMQS